MSPFGCCRMRSGDGQAVEGRVNVLEQRAQPSGRTPKAVFPSLMHANALTESVARPPRVVTDLRDRWSVSGSGCPWAAHRPRRGQPETDLRSPDRIKREKGVW